MTCLSSQEKVTVMGSENPPPSCLNGPATKFPVRTSQIRVVRSHEAEATRVPSFEKATEMTTSSWPRNGPVTSSPVFMSQTRTTPFSEPVAIR